MARIAVATYDPAQVVVSFAGVPISGYADGTFISVTRSADVFTKNKGAGGDVERVNTNAFDFRVEITLLQTATSNTALSALMNTDQMTNVGVLPLIIKDLNGATLFSAPQAWIAKDPDYEFGDSTSGRTWVFDTGRSESLVGGN